MRKGVIEFLLTISVLLCFGYILFHIRNGRGHHKGTKNILSKIVTHPKTRINDFVKTSLTNQNPATNPTTNQKPVTETPFFRRC